MPGVHEKVFLALSKKQNILNNTLEGWYRKRNELEAILNNKTKNSRSQRRVEGGRKQSHLPITEETLAQWIKELNI